MSEPLRVLLFAAARELVGAPEITLPLPEDASAAGVLRALCALHPSLLPHARSLRLAINGAYARPDDVVRPGDEVAVIPPVAGG